MFAKSLGSLFSRTSVNGSGKHTNGKNDANIVDRGEPPEALKQSLLTNGASTSLHSVAGKDGAPEPPPLYATMTDAREIAAFGVIVVALLLGLYRESLWGLEALSPERALRIFYAVTLAAEMAIWSNEFCGHVAWLNTSKFTHRRGLGKFASPLYGFCPMPSLSLGMFALAHLALIVTLLLAAWWPMLMPIAFLLACLVMSHLFWDRQTLGGHGGLPILHTLFCLSLQTEGNEMIVRGCIQTLLAVSYFGSALCKLVTSLCIQRPRMWWGSGEGMKFYLLDSLSIRPMRGIRCAVREWILTTGLGTRPLLDMAMNLSLLFELAVPLLMCFHARFASVCLFFFHYSVWFFFDIDFMSFWGPSLLSCAVADWADVSAREPLTYMWAALEISPVQTGILLSYTVMQVLVSLTVYDLNPRRGEVLPFSAYPMFEEATSLFKESQAMALVLRIPTKVPVPEPYYLRMSALSTEPSGDFLKGAEVLEDLGQRVLVVGIPQQSNPRSSDTEYAGGVWRPQKQSKKNKLENCATGITTVMGYCGADECSKDASGSQALNHERECAASVEQTVILAGNVCWDNCKWSVQQLVHHLNRMTPKDAWTPERMRELLSAYREAEAALALCPRGPAFREEMHFDMCSTPVLKSTKPLLPESPTALKI